MRGTGGGFGSCLSSKSNRSRKRTSLSLMIDSGAGVLEGGGAKGACVSGVLRQAPVTGWQMPHQVMAKLLASKATTVTCCDDISGPVVFLRSSLLMPVLLEGVLKLNVPGAPNPTLRNPKDCSRDQTKSLQPRVALCSSLHTFWKASHTTCHLEPPLNMRCFISAPCHETMIFWRALKGRTT